MVGHRCIFGFLLVWVAGHATGAEDWPTANPKNLGWDMSRLEQLDTDITADKFQQKTSVLVVHDGKLIWEKYYGDGGVDVLNDTRSATKTVTSLLIGAAIAEGHIKNVDVPAFSFFEDRPPHKNPDKRKDAITLKDLLTMSSILECNDDNQYSRGNEERMYIIEDWVGFVMDLPVKGYAPWEDKPWESPYKRSFAYCTAGSFLLGAVIEKATGQTLGEYADHVLHKQMDIVSPQWPVSPLGVYQGGGGTRYRSRDIAKIGEMARNFGVWQGKRILPSWWIEESTRPHVQARDGVTYGYQWWRFSYELNGETTWHWAMSGNGGNYVFVYPEKKLVTVITSRAYGTRSGHEQSQQMYSDFILRAAP